MKIIYLIFPLCFSTFSAIAQESINTTGNDITGSGGSIAYSIGQTVYSYQTGINGNINQGVQQPYEIYTVGLAENESSISLTAYPNPVQNQLTLQVEKVNERMDLEIIDVTGKIIHFQKELKPITKFDFTSYTNGIYFLKVISINKEIKTFKIIKN